jgi:hypothetical protein
MLAFVALRRSGGDLPDAVLALTIVDYQRPDNRQNAIEMLARENAQPLGVARSSRHDSRGARRPEQLVDLRALPGNDTP